MKSATKFFLCGGFCVVFASVGYVLHVSAMPVVGPAPAQAVSAAIPPAPAEPVSMVPPAPVTPPAMPEMQQPPAAMPAPVAMPAQPAPAAIPPVPVEQAPVVPPAPVAPPAMPEMQQPPVATQPTAMPEQPAPVSIPPAPIEQAPVVPPALVAPPAMPEMQQPPAATQPTAMPEQPAPVAIPSAPIEQAPMVPPAPVVPPAVPEMQQPPAATQPVPAQPAPVAVPTQEKKVVKHIDHKADLEKINAFLLDIDNSKEELKKLLARVDSTIDEAKNKTLAARKDSMEIVSQKTAAEAKTLFDKISAQEQEILKMQQTVTTDVSAQFQQIVDKINNGMQEVKKIVEQLQAKGMTLNVAEARVVEKEKVKAAAVQKQIFRSWFVKEQQPIAVAEANPDETFVHYALRKVADVVTGAFRVVYATWQTVKGMIFKPSDTVTPKMPEKSQKQEVVQQAPAAPPSSAGASEQQPKAAGQASAAFLSEGDVKGIREKLDRCEQIVVDLAKMRIDFEIKKVEMEFQLEAVCLTLASNSDVMAGLPMLYKFTQNTEQAATWKDKMQHAIGAVVDAVSYTIDVVLSKIKHFFYGWLVPTWHKFTSDVKEKIAEEEKEAAEKQKVAQKQEQDIQKTLPKESLPEKIPAS